MNVRKVESITDVRLVYGRKVPVPPKKDPPWSPPHPMLRARAD